VRGYLIDTQRPTDLRSVNVRCGVAELRVLLASALIVSIVSPSVLRTARADDGALIVPPAIPPDSIFSDSQKTVPSMAMVPPTNDHTLFLPNFGPSSFPPSSNEPPAPRNRSIPRGPDDVLLAPEEMTPEEQWDDEHSDVPILHPFSGPDKLLKQMTYRKTFTPPGSDNLFGLIDIALEAYLSPKCEVFGAPLLLTPYFTFHWFEGSSPFAVPGSVYDTGFEIRQVRQIGERLSVDAAVAPSVFSDFVNAQSQPFRVVGRAVFMYQYSPTTRVALGATYLGRDDIKVLPVAGVLWRPTPRWEVDALFPKPRAAWNFNTPSAIKRFSRTRVGPWLGFSPIQHYWLYTAGELGGNTWAVREAGIDDRLTYFDLRVVLGIEQRAVHGPRGRIEIGYVFDRKVSYLNGPESLLHDTFMLRGELAH
jgi:hypothetical protein